TKAYLEAETINPLLWKIVYEDNHRFAHSLGLVKEVKFGFIDKFKLKASQFLYERSRGKKKVQAQIQEKSNLQYTRSDFSTQIINPYIKAAILQSDTEFVEKTLETFGLNRAYFENPNNWVSVEFFENFLDALNRRLDLSDLSILAGEIAMRKELVGPGYYVLKWFGNVSFFISQIKKTTEKLNTNRYVTIEKISNNSLIVSFHLKDGYRLPKHRSTDLNFQTLLHHGVCLAQNLKRSDVLVDQIASAYDSKGASRFKVSWKQKSSWLKYLGYALYIAGNAALYKEFPKFREVILGSNLGILFLRNSVNKLSFNKALREIDTFYTDVEENAKKQYDNLFQAKRNLENHHNRLEVLNGISSEIHFSKNIPSILETTSKLICEQFNFSRCMIMLRDPDGFMRTHAVYSHEELPFLKMLWGFEVDLSQKKIEKKVVSTAYHSRQTVLVRDVTKTIDDLTDFSKEMIDQLKTKAYVISPICTEDETHGVVIADKGKENVHEITQLEVQTLEEISVTLAIAISKQKRYDDLNETLTVLKRYNPKVFADNQIDQNKVSLAGSRKEVVSGFLDVRGFTNISDNYPPEVIIDIINHLAILCEDSLDPDIGHIDKFIGDEFFFTWENQDPKVLVQSAFKTVLKIQNKLELFNEEALKKNFPEVRVGIGLDVGAVIRGNIGTEKRMDYTSIGSSVNKAARLQSLNKDYSSTLIISKDFFQFLKEEDKAYFTEQEVSIRGLDQTELVYIFTDFRNEKRENYG
ncbi:MAG: GAF domain-containing protein, partial [Halobacteriovoraceae bacterium]|nr:GAF domain-containing protein [Halobacteriovoraceae bacterium]